MEKDGIVIWGTGRFAELAYYYYRENGNILFFVDSDSSRWDSMFCGLKICSPENLKGCAYKVVIAFQAGKYAVKNTLINEYGIKNVVEFGIEEKIETNFDSEQGIFDRNTIVIGFGGGLGNQLFQYALFNALKSKGKKVVMDVSYYYRNVGVMQFELDEVFGISERIVKDIDIPDSVFWQELIKSNETKNFAIYKEPTVFERDKMEADKSLLSLMGGYIKGTFQTIFFWESVKDKLLDDLKFRKVPRELFEYFDGISRIHTVVSVHIRRGDYLVERNARIYGDICTDKYYEDAIDYFRSKYDDVMFCLFSDDMEYAKGKYYGNEFFSIDRTLVGEYKDWYDMYFMSICDHNIIANSTFSWWGAMLNKNEGKTVIAPYKWVNPCEYIDIYPKEWVVMEGR